MTAVEARRTASASHARRAGATITRRLASGETALVLLLAAATFFVHDVPYALSHPYWADETWVAATTRFPLGDLPDTTSSTPIGWSALLRLVAIGGAQRQRIEPLLFAAATVVVAYLFGRQLGWRDRRVAVGAGVLGAFIVLTFPAMLVRNDLKQYTADAFVGLVALALTSRLERSWSRRDLVALALTAPVGMLFSHAAAFVGVASLAAVGLVLLVRGQWARLRDTVVAGAGTAIAMFGVYELFDARAVVPGLTTYWRGYYVPVDHGLSASVDMVRTVGAAIRPYLGLGPTWLVVALTAAGVVTIACLGRLMVAVAIVMLLPLMVALSALKKYPLFDLRTSTFLLVIVAVTAAIGVCGVCALIARRSVVVGAMIALIAVAASLTQTHTYVRGHTIPDEDVHSQVTYVAAHRSAADVVLVNSNSNWGFGYYWHVDKPARRPDTNVHNYLIAYPQNPQIVLASDRTPATVDAALVAAVHQARTRPGAKIWLVRTHVNGPEAAAWRGSLQKMHLTARPAGPAGLTAVTIGS
jgi:hypothetical protein